MVDAVEIAARYQQSLAEAGSGPVTLRRRQGTTATFTEATVPCYARDVQPTEGVRMSEVPGDKASNDLTVKVSHLDLAAASWPVPPRKGDFLLLSGRTYAVLGAGDMSVAGTFVGYVITARGG